VKSQLAVFRNREAAELFNYIVSYTRLIAKPHSQNEEASNIILQVIPEEQKIIV